jgi:hypothetical protein
MKYFLLAFSTLLFACNDHRAEQKKIDPREPRQMDDFVFNQAAFDSLSEKGSIEDSVISAKGPIQVLNVKLERKTASGERKLTVTYKNTSAKNIRLVNFGWIGEHDFLLESGQPSTSNNQGSFKIVSDVKAGETVTNTCRSLQAVTRLKRMQATFIEFEDLTEWDIKDFKDKTIDY